MRSRRVLGPALVVLVAGCAPKLESKGSITVEGQPFTPALCQVLVGGVTIELSDAKGAKLGLALPPQRLDAFKTISGTPTVTYQPTTGPAAELGPCGTLELTGEGYHGSGKRAASGKMKLSCAKDVKVEGDYTFSGCF
jgi:hypothetical protein